MKLERRLSQPWWLSVAVPVGSLVAQLMASAFANGDGSLDHSGLLRGVERLSGRTNERNS